MLRCRCQRLLPFVAQGPVPGAAQDQGLACRPHIRLIGGHPQLWPLQDEEPGRPNPGELVHNLALDRLIVLDTIREPSSSLASGSTNWRNLRTNDTTSPLACLISHNSISRPLTVKACEEFSPFRAKDRARQEGGADLPFDMVRRLSAAVHTLSWGREISCGMSSGAGSALNFGRVSFIGEMSSFQAWHSKHKITCALAHQLFLEVNWWPGRVCPSLAHGMRARDCLRSPTRTRVYPSEGKLSPRSHRRQRGRRQQLEQAFERRRPSLVGAGHACVCVRACLNAPFSCTTKLSAVTLSELQGKLPLKTLWSIFSGISTPPSHWLSSCCAVRFLLASFDVQDAPGTTKSLSSIAFG